MSCQITAEYAAKLRRSAEKKLAKHGAPAALSEIDTQRLLHELQVHQIELEMQNEALQEALEYSEKMQRFTKLHEFAPVAYFSITPESTILLLNQAAASLLGQERSKLKGQRLAAFVNVNSKAVFEIFLQDVLGSKGILSCELWLFSAETRPRLYVRIDAAVDPEGRACNLAVTDITEHQVLEEEIRRRDQLQRALLDNIPCLAWLKDEQSRFLAVNRPFARNYHLSPDSLIGKDDFWLSPCASAEAYRTIDQDVMLRRVSRRVEEIIEVNGQARWFETFKSPVVLDGTVIGTAGFSHDITERREAERLIRESEERLRNFIENAPMIIISWDRDFRVIQWAGEAETLLGWRAEDMLGKQVGDLHVVYEDDMPIVQEAMNKLIHGGAQSVICANRNLTRDGRILHCVWYNSAQWKANGELHSVLSQGIDITEQKLAESALMESEKKYRQLSQRLAEVFWGTNSGTWEWNVQSGELVCNERWAEIVGYTLEELSPITGDTWFNLIHPVDLELANEQLDRCFSRETDNVGFEVRMRCKNGDWVWVLSRGRLVERSVDGLPLRMSGTHQDISARKNAEAALLVAKTEAERASRAKSRFLAAASHDLRQPLAALGLYVGVLKNRLIQTEAPLLTNISSCLSSLNELLNDLLDFSKLDAGVINPEISDFPIADLLASLVAVHVPEAKLKGLGFRWHPSRYWVHTDSVLFKRMLSNLIANAIRYTEQGGVLMACRRKQGKIWIEIWDTGVGIPEENLGEIFEEFKQLKNNGRSRGSGLGLAIVAKTATLLGLEIRVKSRPGRGSLFAVELPPGKSRRKSMPRKQISRPLCVALVDDNVTVLNALTFSLEALGHQVIGAKSGTELLSIIAGAAPDIIVSDFRLADEETGFDVIQAARKAFGEQLPALLITGDTDPNIMRAMAQQGIIVQYKPMDLDVLRSHLARLTNRRS